MNWNQYQAKLLTEQVKYQYEIWDIENKIETIRNKSMNNVIKGISNDPGTYIFYCPGCKMHHQVPTKGSGRPNWEFNGDLEKPTFKPSLMMRYPKGKKQIEFVCHLFIRNGKIEYCNDSSHVYKGRTIKMRKL